MTTLAGFIGLGLMGTGMAKVLLKERGELVVWNRTASKMEPLIEAGATAANSPAEVVSQCRLIVVCVSTTKDVQEVLLEDNFLDALREDTVVIDCSSISPDATRVIADRLAERGAGLVDAPVSGGTEGAEQGTLSIMVGGSVANVERAQPVLDAMGSNVVHVGESGSGQATKLVNQALVGGVVLSMSESLLFARDLGLDLRKVLEAVTGGAAGSWMLSNRGPQIVEDDWAPGFTIDLQQKDLRLVQEAAQRVGSPLLAAGLAHQLYAVLQARGEGGLGNHALIRALQSMKGE